MTKTKNFPSIYDVARAAGVSPSTVSRYLNRTTFVSDEKSANIERAIVETGYKPSYKVNTEKKGRTMTIGVLVQHPDSPYNVRILNDLEYSLKARGYSLVIATGHWQRKLEKHSLEYLAKSGVDGVIIVAGDISDEDIIAYAKHTPVVAVGYEVEGKNVCSISFDNVLGGYIATLHLLQQGHVNIAHIKGLHTQPDTHARYEGYKKALSEAGINVNQKLVKQGNFSSEQGYEKTVELIKSKDYFSAIFAANDQTAYGAIKALTENGYKVPEDVSVIGFDDLPTSTFFTPSLTTLRQPIEELGKVCGDTILKMLNLEELDVRVPPIDLVVRQSTLSLFKR